MDPSQRPPESNGAEARPMDVVNDKPTVQHSFGAPTATSSVPSAPQPATDEKPPEQARSPPNLTPPPPPEPQTSVTSFGLTSQPPFGAPKPAPPPPPPPPPSLGHVPNPPSTTSVANGGLNEFTSAPTSSGPSNGPDVHKSSPPAPTSAGGLPMNRPGAPPGPPRPSPPPMPQQQQSQHPPPPQPPQQPPQHPPQQQNPPMPQQQHPPQQQQQQQQQRHPMPMGGQQQQGQQQQQQHMSQGPPSQQHQQQQQFSGHGPPPGHHPAPGQFHGGPPAHGPPPPHLGQQPHPGVAPNQAVGMPPQPAGMRELRVEDALLYLDEVKREFKDRPRIYNEFLAIMKNFKSHVVDTPGVIARVSKLFRGYNNLILGFNTFLPDGYKISLADLERREAEERAREASEKLHRARAGGALSSGGPQQPPMRPSPPGAQTSQGQQQQQQQQQPPQWARNKYGEMEQLPPSGKFPSQEQAEQEAQQSRQPEQARSGPPPQQKQPQQPPRAPVPQPPQHQAVEFDHAISYVTTIKRRFSNDPSTYHQFLEILHTYQKEQRGIKEVLEQVAHLFQDHPDLLKEFTFFLPDAVQEQAKERLHRAAAESEDRLSAQRQQQMEQYQQSIGRSAPGHQQFIDMTGSQMPMVGRRDRGFDGKQAGAQQQQPESYVYNSAVERQFFDAAREALTSYSRDGGQAWAEFLKCLDMYAQEILSRSEMLTFVEPLLGKRNNKLFEEFKRILTAAGSPAGAHPPMEDSWHSVPLAEIDFSRCRRCSPSYRALPRDYPAPPCSDRSAEEAKVLNDIWVSLPVGSEESYTFRHMRRNTYEEILFRCEDERFEIDMAIDSNAATLRRLMPVAEEITQLAQEEMNATDLGSKSAAEGTGLGGNRFQYTFDKSILGVIHRNSIARIYGDYGQEMLDLLVKNPTVAVPLVVQRLRQKDEEWRAVRDRLNRHWKELAELNYYKSVDHRGLTWRTTDKRATSTRTLLAEIKDRAANGGFEGKEALRIKLDKAKEEHGSFYEVTKAECLSQNLDLTFLPKPDRRLFTPHLSLMYENNSWAQRDAYRILAFALERGTISPADKERCHRLWVEFLGPWFELSLNWMQKPAVSFQESKPRVTKTPTPTVVSEEEDDSIEEEEEVLEGRVITEELLQNADPKNKGFADHHPLPAGAHVLTLYGEGKIIEFRRSDDMYVVKLPFAAESYLRPSTVLCSVLPVEKTAYTRQLRSEDHTKLARPNDQLVFGTQSLYLFFRLHQILVRRLNIAKRLAYTVGDDRSLQTMVEQMHDHNPNTTGRRRYEAYLSLVYALLDGGVGGAAEGGKYEDRVRSLLGHGAYELATMDKLISHIWKNLQAMAQDETMWNLVQVYRRHKDAGSFKPEAFRQEAAYQSEGELMYAFQYCPVQGQNQSVLYTEYLSVMDDGEDDEEMDEEEETPESSEPPAKRSKR